MVSKIRTRFGNPKDYMAWDVRPRERLATWHCPQELSTASETLMLQLEVLKLSIGSRSRDVFALSVCSAAARLTIWLHLQFNGNRANHISWNLFRWSWMSLNLFQTLQNFIRLMSIVRSHLESALGGFVVPRHLLESVLGASVWFNFKSLTDPCPHD